MLPRATHSLRAVRSHTRHIISRDCLWSRRYATINASVAQAIRDGFVEVRSALALVNQGERLNTAQEQVVQLTKQLDVSALWSFMLFVDVTGYRIQSSGPETTHLRHENSSSFRTFQSRPGR